MSNNRHNNVYKYTLCFILTKTRKCLLREYLSSYFFIITFVFHSNFVYKDGDDELFDCIWINITKDKCYDHGDETPSPYYDVMVNQTETNNLCKYKRLL